MASTDLQPVILQTFHDINLPNVMIDPVAGTPQISANRATGINNGDAFEAILVEPWSVNPLTGQYNFSFSQQLSYRNQRTGKAYGIPTGKLTPPDGKPLGNVLQLATDGKDVYLRFANTCQYGGNISFASGVPNVNYIKTNICESGYLFAAYQLSDNGKTLQLVGYDSNGRPGLRLNLQNGEIQPKDSEAPLAPQVEFDWGVHKIYGKLARD